MTRLTPADRSRLKKLAEEATKGPWYTDGLLFIGTDERGHGRGAFLVNNHNGGNDTKCEDCDWNPVPSHWEYTLEEQRANTEFIAASREAVPALLAELEAAEKERDELQAEVKRQFGVISKQSIELIDIKIQREKARSALASKDPS